MGTYLVTGAAGFIGAAVAKRLLKEGNEVVVIDNLSTGYFENIPFGTVPIIGNTFDKEVINVLTNYKFDAIFHIAGQSGGITSYDNPVYDMQSNIESTLRLLEYAKNYGCKKFIYASSMSVYGDENPCPVVENSEKSPKTFYAVGKIASEQYMKMYAEYGIQSIALRLNNTYGPGQNMNNLRQGMVSIFIAQAIKDHKIHAMGNKERFRDFVYIDDVVDAFLKARKDIGKSFEVYNVATNKKTTVDTLVEQIRSNLPFEIAVKHEGSTPGDQFGIYCDFNKIKEELGWQPKVMLDEGLDIMINWALDAMKV